MKKLATALALATFALTGTACDQYLFAANGTDRIEVPPQGCNDGDDSGTQPVCSPNKSPSKFLAGN